MHRTGAVFCSRILNECVIYLIHMRKKREAAGLTPERSTEELEYKSAHAQPEEKRPYTPRPKSQIVLAWVLREYQCCAKDVYLLSCTPGGTLFFCRKE